MDGFVFAAAIFATWIIAAGYALGRRGHFIEKETGVAPKWADAMIFGAVGVMLTMLYFANYHPIIAHMLFIVQGFIVALVPMYFVRYLLRPLRVEPRPKR